METLLLTVNARRVLTSGKLLRAPTSLQVPGLHYDEKSYKLNELNRVLSRHGMFAMDPHIVVPGMRIRCQIDELKVITKR